MKKLDFLKLNNLSKAEMEKKEMHNLSGGACTIGSYPCGCACAYYNSGGSGTYMNCNANMNIPLWPSYI